MANLPYRTDIIGKIKPLKTFFATIFFVALGMQLNITFSLALLKIATILFAAIFIVKPMIIYLITTVFGYEKRTAFLAGLSLGQVSEFSLIMISLPFVMGNISSETFSLVILLASVSMAVTAYLIEFKERIYTFFEPALTFISKVLPIKQKKLHYQTRETKYSVVLIGKHRMGSVLFDSLKSLRKKVMVVDYNPDIIKDMISKRETCMYGDIATKEVLENLKLNQVKILISTVPSEKDSLYLINNVKQKNKRIKVFVTANHMHQAKKLYDAGADYVILPQVLSGEKVSLLLKKVLKDTKYSKKLKENHAHYVSKLL